MKMHKALCLACIAAAVALMVIGAASGSVRPAADTYTARAINPTVTALTMPRTGIDVNHADTDALDTLPGIGPALAQAIIDERIARGRFFYPEDLLQVRGIGPARLKAIIELVAIGE